MLHEFSRILDTNTLGSSSVIWSYKATPLECDAIKKRLKILDLKSLTTQGTIEKKPTHKFIEIEASIEAVLLLECTASLEPFPYTAHPQLRFWVSKDFTAETQDSLYQDSDVDELIKLPQNGLLDIGEILLQYLSLSLPQYPRKSSLDLQCVIEESSSKGIHTPFKNLDKVLKE